METKSILNLLDHEFIVIACGGGGVPVVKTGNGDYVTVPAVIDKDFASAKLAELVGADYLFILTAVDRVAIRYGTPQQKDLAELTVERGQALLRRGPLCPRFHAAQGAGRHLLRPVRPGTAGSHRLAGKGSPRHERGERHHDPRLIKSVQHPPTQEEKPVSGGVCPTFGLRPEERNDKIYLSVAKGEKARDYSGDRPRFCHRGLRRAPL